MMKSLSDEEFDIEKCTYWCGFMAQVVSDMEKKLKDFEENNPGLQSQVEERRKIVNGLKQCNEAFAYSLLQNKCLVKKLEPYEK